MATEKLYYQDAHQAQFQATVLSCRPGKHGYDVVLDRTCFYPEGGGQPGDTGVLSGVRVTDTHEAGGEIVHYCEAPLAEGQTVEGAIDYDRRFEFMPASISSPASSTAASAMRTWVSTWARIS